VDFRYTEEQLALQETLQRYLSRHYDFERRRDLARSAQGFSADVWRQFADLGILALPFPERFGGMGGTAVDLLIVMEQLGRGLVLEPFASTVVLCGGLIRDAGSDAHRSRLLPEIGAGRLKLALAAYEAAGRFDLDHPACTAVPAAGGWRLSGHKSVVLDAPSADWFIVSAGNGAAGRGLSLFLVPRDAAGLELLPYPTQSGGRAGDLRLSDVRVDEASLLGCAGAGLEPLQRAIDQAAAASCAEALGVIGMLNRTTLEYLKTRKQFGVPIGAFQSLQHRMADMYIAEEQARSMSLIAALHAQDPDPAIRRRAITAAKAYVGHAARFVGQQAVQLHGAMGMVDEHIVSHYFKRLTVIDMTFGDAEFHLARFSDSLLATASGG